MSVKDLNAVRGVNNDAVICLCVLLSVFSNNVILHVTSETQLSGDSSQDVTLVCDAEDQVSLLRCAGETRRQEVRRLTAGLN